jgi:Beta-galactosidase/beta-glucuronidase
MGRQWLICLVVLVCCNAVTAQDIISLAGEWTVRLDEKKTGEQEQWFRQPFEKKISLPGTLDDAGMGAPPTLTADTLKKDVLIHLQRKHSYIGHAWYAKEINIPQSWSNKQIELYLERVLWTTKVWIDGHEAGTRESLSAPHTYNVSELLTPGKHLLVIRVDNTKQYDITHRDMAHAYTDGTQIIWNGMIGKLQLTASSKNAIRSVQLYPSAINKYVRVEAEIATNQPGTLTVQIVDKQNKQIAVKKLAARNGKQVLIVPVPKAQLWDEFNPVLYTAKLQFSAGGTKHETSSVFGLRDISNRNSLLWINGRRLFLRGTLECAIFPLTGHPPMDKAGWQKVFSAAKAYGLNHLRFHSWCPPKAAFEMADSMGFYLQVELPYWSLNVGKDEKTNRFLEEEAMRISNEYGSHPSFCFYSMGNELQGDFNWLTGLMKKTRAADPRHLYTTTTFTFQKDHGRWPEPDDDFYITQYTKKGWVRGQGIFNTYAPDFKTDYTKAIDSLPVPIITHEIGQYSVYPNLPEIKKYTGVLDPLNFKAIQKDLQRKGMLSFADQFTLASGKFSANLYKEEIERALKTKGMSGFQLLDLHDFPGQGTALIGILDAFWDSKGLVSPEQHRMYCGPVVPLIRYDKALYTNDETFTAKAEIANFSSGALKNVTPVWQAKDANGKILASGKLPATNIDLGNGIELGDIKIDLKTIHQATALTIELSLQGTAHKNNWTIWVYPQQLPAADNNIVFTTTLSEAIDNLNLGKKVLFNPDTAQLKGVTGRFAPVFWSPVHFPDQPGTMGVLCDPGHTALKHFPTDFYSNWQWWDLITASKTMIIDSLPDMQPVVRVIDNFFKNRKMANVIEARVGNGKLVLVSMDITRNLDKRPAARQLRYSLEQYMAGNNFAPAVELNEAQLKSLIQ